LWAQVPRAAEVEGVKFQERLSLGATELRLHGVGLMRYRVLIKGYVAALYLAEPFDGEASPSAVLADVPRRIEIEYFWPIPAEALARITNAGVARNVDEETLERLRAPLERLGDMYEDVDPGDRYSLTYLPGVGTELALNGEPQGVVEGAALSAALFAIWLGERPIDESLREQLLRRS
jgi:hypothetical protein